MDAGSKLSLLVVAGAIVVFGGQWLFRKLFPPPPEDPTAPKGLNEGGGGDYSQSKDD